MCQTPDWSLGDKYLRENAPELAPFVDKYAPCPLQARPQGDYFSILLTGIITAPFSVLIGLPTTVLASISPFTLSNEPPIIPSIGLRSLSNIMLFLLDFHTFTARAIIALTTHTSATGTDMLIIALTSKNNTFEVYSGINLTAMSSHFTPNNITVVSEINL